jgi:hypothetical protein
MNSDAHPSRSSGTCIPFYLYSPRRIAVEDLWTVGKVNSNSTSSRDKTNNPISGERLTTFGEANHNIVKARNSNSNPLPTDLSRPMEYSLKRSGLFFQLLWRRHILRQEF